MPTNEATLTTIITSAAQATGDRQNRLCPEPSLSTVKRVKVDMDLKPKVPQIISTARYSACSDIRMSYSVWIMLKSLADGHPPQLLFNFDATKFVVGQSDKNKKVCSVRVGDHCDRSPLSLLGDESLDIGIKWKHLGSASGAASPMVLLVAIDSLKSEEFEFYAILGLTATADPVHPVTSVLAHRVPELRPFSLGTSPT